MREESIIPGMTANSISFTAWKIAVTSPDERRGEIERERERERER